MLHHRTQLCSFSTGQENRLGPAVAVRRSPFPLRTLPPRPPPPKKNISTKLGFARGNLPRPRSPRALMWATLHQRPGRRRTRSHAHAAAFRARPHATFSEATASAGAPEWFGHCTCSKEGQIGGEAMY